MGGPDNGEPTGSAGLEVDEHAIERRSDSLTEHWTPVAFSESTESQRASGNDEKDSSSIEKTDVQEIGGAEELEVDGLQDLLKKFLRISETPSGRDPILSSFDVDGVAEYIQQGRAKRIICLCGAGISVSAGIPDFRSPHTGMYSKLKEMGMCRPEDVFSINYFREDPGPFYAQAKEIMPGKFKPTPCHYLMALLAKKNILLRCYTQNIDSLERIAGIDPELIVPAHGNFDGAHCIDCHQEIPIRNIETDLLNGTPALCPACKGYVKPDIVFFGESLPARFFSLAKADFPECDLLLVMGSSLSVYPFAALVGQVEDGVPRLLINREKVGELEFGKGNYRDAFFQGDCDDGASALTGLLGWKDELEELIASGPPPMD